MDKTRAAVWNLAELRLHTISKIYHHCSISISIFVFQRTVWTAISFKFSVPSVHASHDKCIWQIGASHGSACALGFIASRFKHRQVSLQSNSRRDGQKKENIFWVIKMFSVEVGKRHDILPHSLSWFIVNITAVARWVSPNKIMLLELK